MFQKKTKLCNHFQTTGQCPFAGNCNFAHGAHEMRPATAAPAAAQWGAWGGAPRGPPMYQPAAYAQYAAPAPMAGYGGKGMMMMRGPGRGPSMKGGLRSGTFKTSMCQHWLNNAGVCPFAERCAFAHGEEELQAKVPQKRPFEAMYAGYGAGYGAPMPMYAAAAAYGAPDAKRRKRTELYKTTLCAHFQSSGVCPYAEKCSFAHGEQELHVPGAAVEVAAAV